MIITLLNKFNLSQYSYFWQEDLLTTEFNTDCDINTPY